MLKTLNSRLLLVVCLAVSLSIFSSDMAEGQGDPFEEIKGTVAGISLKEKETLQKLFTQAQEIQEMERHENEINMEITKAKDEISVLQKKLQDEEAKYESERENLKQVLQSYQRMGPGSYLEIILKSDDLADLLRRINILRDITRNTGDLLDEISTNRVRLTAEKMELADKLKQVEAQQECLIKTLNEKKELKDGLEKYLVSLAGERTHYEGYLTDLENAWSDLKPLFSTTVKELSAILENGNVPQEAFKISYSLSGIKVALDQKAINEVIKNNPLLQNLELAFNAGKVEIKVSDKNLYLAGKFVIADGHSLRFEVEEGSFFGMALEPGKAKELFQDGSLTFNLESELKDFDLKSVEVTDGYLVLSI